MARKRSYPDHARAWALIWRAGEEASNKSGLSVKRITEAGIGIADLEGLDALTMRRVAESLGVGTMSLYTHVPGKEELVFLMIEAVHGELASVEGIGWRDQIKSIARQRWDLYCRHSWLVEVPITRPVLGPNIINRYEAELRAVDGIGLKDVEMDAAINLVNGHVAATARRFVEIGRDAARSGITDEQWWLSVLPTMMKVFVKFPLMSRVGEAIGASHSDPHHDLDFGLQCILNGIEARLGSHGE